MTNRNLQLTVELTQISGETQYKSPPLPKGEIMVGIANLLDNSPYRNRNLERSTYLRTNSNSPASGIGSTLRVDSPGMASARSNSALGSGAGSRSRMNSPVPPADSGPLRTATDNIIEAIFNPVPSSSKTSSPFTYYIAPPPPPPPTLSRVDSVSGCGSGSASITGSVNGSMNTHTTSTSTRSHSRNNSGSSVDADADVEFGAIVAPSRSGSTRSAHSHSTTNSSADRRKWWQRIGSRSQPASLSLPHPNAKAHASRPVSPSMTMDDEDNEPVSGLESNHGHGGVRRRATARSVGHASLSSTGSASRRAAVVS